MSALFRSFVRWLRLSRVRALNGSISLEQSLERAHQMSMDRDLTGSDQAEVIRQHDQPLGSIIVRELQRIADAYERAHK